MKETCFARHGDYSPYSFLSIQRKNSGFIIKCAVDENERYTTPNPMFRDPRLGGHSPATWKALSELYSVLTTDQHMRGLLYSTEHDGKKLLITRTDVITVATQDMSGEYGSIMFVGNRSHSAVYIQTLYEALKKDACMHPAWNAW